MLLKDASTRLATQGIKPLIFSLETASLTTTPILQLFIKVDKPQIKRTLSEVTGPRILLQMLKIEDLLLPFTYSSQPVSLLPTWDLNDRFN